ncbi:ABC transporter permease [Variovorax paradoxus]|uniref:Binding-protein-dependent transport systems inner membrane component n=1 Tax=Variovorax paradoxus (strain EPS) TaxID=595537 RepID=E6V5L4_VARPE|nr:ABC transporter permease [Variovorax paradoxus]ADU35911.1 binding-protein-dependent transport systems inner membrane component [Variovorax paradoxus EPS]
MSIASPLMKHEPGQADKAVHAELVEAPRKASTSSARTALAPADEAPFVPARWRWVRKHPTLIIGALLLIAVAALSIAAPWIATHDPQDIDPLARMQPPSGEHWFGTDALGRDVFSRAVWGGQVSMIVGASVAVLATVFGVLIGLFAGFVRWADGPVMRVMDGLMAIPGILLAIALMAVTRASLTTVIVAITVPEIPRVVRLVRSLALTLREQLYVEAAHAVGTRLPVILFRHVLPNMVAPLIVQSTFVAAAAVLTEAALSFLGVGVPAQTPSWGNMMAEGRNFVAVAFHIILYPGLLLAATVLAINLLGDGLRDALDPRLARQL